MPLVVSDTGELSDLAVRREFVVGLWSGYLSVVLYKRYAHVFHSIIADLANKDTPFYGLYIILLTYSPLDFHMGIINTVKLAYKTASSEQYVEGVYPFMSDGSPPPNTWSIGISRLRPRTRSPNLDAEFELSDGYLTTSEGIDPDMHMILPRALPTLLL